MTLSICIPTYLPHPEQIRTMRCYVLLGNCDELSLARSPHQVGEAFCWLTIPFVHDWTEAQAQCYSSSLVKDGTCDLQEPESIQ